MSTPHFARRYVVGGTCLRWRIVNRMSQTCRDAVLQTFEKLEIRPARGEFAPITVIHEVQSDSELFQESTIRTHIVSRMCVQAPKHRSPKCEDLDRVSPGMY